MTPTELHHYDVEIHQDTGIVRFSCPQCHRCLEAGPDGLRLVHRGDQAVRHAGGSLSGELTVTPASGPAPRTVH